MMIIFDSILLRMIHEVCDVPMKRQMEVALSWSITGMGRLPPSSVDILDHRRQFHLGMGSRQIYMETMVKLPLPSGKSYHIYEALAWYWTSTFPGEWELQCASEGMVPEMCLYPPGEPITAENDEDNAILFYEQGCHYEHFSYCPPGGPRMATIIAAYYRDDWNEGMARDIDYEK